MNASFHREENWAHKSSLASPLFIEVSVPSQKSEWSCVCVFGVSTAFVSMKFQVDFETILTMLNFLFLILS